MERNARLQRIAGIITAALVAITGISLAVVCIVIYKTGGDRPFTRELVGEYLKYCTVQGILTLISIITGVILKFTHPVPEKNPRGERDEYVTKKKLSATLEKKNPDALSDERILKERRTRRIIAIAYAAVAAVLLAVALLSSLLTEYTTDAINSTVARVATVVISLFIAAAALGYVADRFARKSADRESDVLKQLIAEGGAKNTSPVCPTENKSALYMNISRAAIAVLAITFIVIGIFNGGMADVLGKAVRICTECIGLG